MSRHENYNSQILPFIICLVYNNRQKKGTLKYFILSRQYHKLNCDLTTDQNPNFSIFKLRCFMFIYMYTVHRQCLSLDPTPLKIPNAIYHIKRWLVFLLLIHCDIYITLSLSEYVAKWLCYINKHVFAHILSVMVHISISHCVPEAPRSFNVAYCFRRFAFRARMRSYE